MIKDDVGLAIMEKGEMFVHMVEVKENRAH